MNTVIKGDVGKYTLEKGHKLGVEDMPTSVITTETGLKVSYVNPDTPEELAEELIKVFALTMYNTVIKEKEKQIEKQIEKDIKEDEEVDKSNENALRKGA